MTDRMQQIPDSRPDPAEAYAQAEEAQVCGRCGLECEYVVASHAQVWSALAEMASRPEEVAVTVLLLAGLSHGEVARTFAPPWPRWRVQAVVRRLPVEVRRLFRARYQGWADRERRGR